MKIGDRLFQNLAPFVFLIVAVTIIIGERIGLERLLDLVLKLKRRK